MEEVGIAHNILIGKPEGIARGRCKCRWEDNIRMVKVKVKLFLCLTKHHAVKAYWGSGGIAPRIL
jgi:hypothetical protein